jgi:hypothetical protein
MRIERNFDCSATAEFRTRDTNAHELLTLASGLFGKGERQ